MANPASNRQPAQASGTIDVAWTERGILVHGFPTGPFAPELAAACISAVLHDVATAEEIAELLQELGPERAYDRLIAAGVTPLPWTRAAAA